MNRERAVDVLILGGGPAGSTAAIMLADAGIPTTVINCQKLSRPHQGESLLPHTLPILDQLGVHDTIRQLPCTRRKSGVTFASGDGGKRVTYCFDSAFPPALPHAYNVHRDQFDAALKARAKAAGAEVLEEWRAVTPIWEGNRLVGLIAKNPEGVEFTFLCKTFLDASGQASFLARSMGWRFPYPRHRKVAAIAHFTDVASLPDHDSGNSTIVLTEGGWFYFIPLANNTHTVGAVVDQETWQASGADSRQVFTDAIAKSPEIARRLASAKQIESFATAQNFSYRVMTLAGDGFCLLGDASGFLDPILSSGVFVALATAASAAQDVIDARTRLARINANDFAPTVILTRSLHRLFFRFTRAFYDRFFLPLFFTPPNIMQLPASLASLLAGDVVRPGRWRRMLPFFGMVTTSRVHHLSAALGRPFIEPFTAAPAKNRKDQ